MKAFRKFIRMINLFDIDLSGRSYTSPRIRIFISLPLRVGIGVLRLAITIKDPTLNIVLSLLMLAVMAICTLIFFIAMVECLQVGHNRKIDKEREKDVK